MKNHKIITLLIIIVACILFIAFNYSPALKENIDNNNNVDETVTRYFGNEAKGDVDGDGVEDRAYLITEDGGGSGTFYYVTVALKTPTKEVSAGKVFLGDRIAPQSTSFEDGIITVNFADRKLTESFADEPSIGKSLSVIYDKNVGQIIDITSSSSSDATSTSTAMVSPKPDPSKSKITDKSWIWVKTIYNDGKVVNSKIKDSFVITKDSFVITFAQENRFSAKTDCNSVGGEYTINKNKIVLDKMMSTLMACTNSQEREFTKMLSEADNFFINSSGELVLSLKYDSGSMIFK